jgi:hypothetical protein
MKTTKLLVCAISIAAAVAAARASAQNLSATPVGISPGLVVNGTVDNGSSTYDYPSGVLQFTDFDAFCVEPGESLTFGETLVYQAQDSNLLVNSEIIARLVGGYLASPQTSRDAAAVQWAIWEATTEDLSALSLSDGKVRITPVSQLTADLANQYLANVNNFTPAALTYLTNNGHQDVVSWNVVPEPGSLGLAAFSVVFLLRRRR